MKPAVLTIVSVLTLAGAFSISGTMSGGDAMDPGIDPIATASTSLRSDRRERLAATGAAIEFAQAEMPAKPAETPVDQTAEKPVVDESALRYFASKGDTVRLEAEIARLRALHPDWTPPADPLAAPENTDRQLVAMWKLFSEAKFDDLRKAIADRQIAEPGWKAPVELLDRLAAAETRAKMIAASNARQYDAVVDLGAASPSLLTCSDLDVLWRVAEAFGKTARVSRASDAYGYILDNCTKEPDRLATLMKASALLDTGQMQALLTREKTLADGTGEFEPIRDDLARRFVGEGGINAELEVAPGYLDRLEKLATQDGKPSDALLLGWYYIKRDKMTEAANFFRIAHDREDTPSASQGLALTLIAAKKPREAEDIMYKWRASSKDTWATYFAATANLLAIQPPPVIEAEVLTRISGAVTEKREIKTAEEFGWYALAYQQPRTAAQWFRTTLGWKPDHEPAAYGLAVSRLRLRDTAGVREIQKLWAGRSERIATVADARRKRPKLEDSIPSPDGGNPADPGVDGSETQSIEPGDGVDLDIITRGIRKPVVVAQVQKKSRSKGCGASVDPSTMPPGAAIDRGWCLMQLNRPIEAAVAFEVGLRSPSAKAREDAAYGQSLAFLRAGLVDQAAVSATKARQGLKRAVELQTSILSNRASNAFDAGRYRETIVYLDQLAQLQTERADLMVLRAYAYRRLGRKAEAVRIFEALVATGNRAAIQGLGEIRAEDTPN
jgi:Flp pilus assembly protein TadD